MKLLELEGVDMSSLFIPASSEPNGHAGTSI